jgi:hypothetical protein
LMAWHMPHSESAAGTASLVGHDLAALGILSMADYITAYVARTGLDPRPHLAAYLAYNFFRIAAILQGIIGRVPRRHRDIRIRAGQGRDGSPARRQSLGIRAGSIEDSFPLRRAETYALDRVADHSLHRRHNGCERVGNREGYGGALQKQVHYPATHRTNFSTICLDK